MDVSIIIVNYNTKDLIINCLKSIIEHTKGIEFEIIVVDNASADGSQQMVQSTFPQVRLIESSENMGFGRANNLGASIALGEYLFFLNSDTILINNAVKCLHTFFESHLGEGIGTMGSLLLNNKINPIHSSGKFPSIGNTLKITFCHYWDRSLYLKNQRREQSTFKGESYFKVDYVTGADLFISHKLFDSVGGFDPQFFLYYEETDLQKRINRLELKSIIIDGAKIMHFEGGSNKYPLFSQKTRIIVTKSMFLYFKKHENLLKYNLFRFCYLIIRLPILFDIRISMKDRIKYITFLVRE